MASWSAVGRCIVLSMVLNGPQLASPVQAEDLYPFTSSLNGNGGYIDARGAVVIYPQFLGAEPFSEGLAAVLVAGPRGTSSNWGFIDSTGKIVIQPRFERVGPFSDGLAAAANDAPKGNYGYIDTTGKFQIAPTLQQPACGIGAPFREGLAAVLVQSKTGFIQKDGAFRIQPQFDPSGCDESYFSDGLALVRLQGKPRYIDQSGTVRIAVDFEDAQPFSEGLAAVKINGKYGYINRDGSFAIVPRFRQARNFSEGLAAVDLAEPGDSCADPPEPAPMASCFGYIDRSGTVRISPAFSDARQMASGRAVVTFGTATELFSTPTEGYIRRDGTYLTYLDMSRQRSLDFRGGLASKTDIPLPFTNSDSFTTYIDLNGRAVFKTLVPVMGQVCGFEGICFVRPPLVDFEVRSDPPGARIMLIPRRLFDMFPVVLSDRIQLLNHLASEVTAPTQIRAYLQDYYLVSQAGGVWNISEILPQAQQVIEVRTCASCVRLMPN